MVHKLSAKNELRGRNGRQREELVRFKDVSRFQERRCRARYAFLFYIVRPSFCPCVSFARIQTG